MFRFRDWTRHSLILVIAGALYMGIGVAFFFAPPMTKQDPSLRVALHWLTLNEWGWVYIFVGALSMFSATWPMGAEKWGYTLLTTLSSMWAAFYTFAVAFYHAPPITLISAFIWALFAFIWWGVSGLIAPQRITKVISDDSDN